MSNHIHLRIFGGGGWILAGFFWLQMAELPSDFSHQIFGRKQVEEGFFSSGTAAVLILLLCHITTSLGKVTQSLEAVGKERKGFKGRTIFSTKTTVFLGENKP